MTIDNNQVHYNALRKALVNGNAAVMVGAGFSRNAQNGDSLATWGDLANRLWLALNPEEAPLNGFSTSVVTQLGEQFAKVFSKPALEELLKEMVPDDRVHPGPLHEKLMELPWVEIFTTNYDTLLERTAEHIVGRAHYTVYCREDIPQSKILNRRRIVKLHGSFPSQRPFIFTEEEYRTYPKDFAPLVNLVRQALIENVFVLVGFSGDDPNFLHWIGWVRDMLDEHALPIYLLLNKSPSLGQQRLLESRKVTPIVLPLLDGVDADDYAGRLSSFFDFINPSNEPKDVQWGAVVHEGTHKPDSETVEQRKNSVLDSGVALFDLRRSYPGWLVAPESVRGRLKYTLDFTHPFELNADRLELLQENDYLAIPLLSDYAFCQDVLLQSMDDRLARLSIKALTATAEFKKESIAQTSGILKKLGGDTRSKFRKRWRELGLSTLRWAREGLHRHEFEELEDMLDKAMPDDMQLRDEISYEKVLFALYAGDRVRALQRLNDWELNGGDGYMLVRKGMLLSEAGQAERGFSVSLSGLQQLRRDQRSRSDVTRYLSEEAWACLAISRQQRAMWFSRLNEKESAEREQVSARLTRRLVELAAKGFDVNREIERLEAALEAEARNPSELVSVTPAFDLGDYNTSRSLTAPASLTKKILAAFSWLTLVDRVALVPRIGMTTFGIESYVCAGWWIQYSDSMQRVLSVLTRTMSTSALNPRDPSDPSHSKGWLSRYQVAKVDEAVAVRICETSLSQIETILGGSPVDDAEQTLSFHIQIFGRLVIRISNVEKVEELAHRVIAFHATPPLVSYSRIWRYFSIALVRCFESMTPIRQRALLPRLWEVSRSHLGGAPWHFEQDWVQLHRFGPRTQYVPNANPGAVVGVDFAQTFEELLSDLHRPSAQKAWALAWQYLYLLNRWSLLDDNQKGVVREILWRNGDTWPTLPNFYPEAALAWGQPDEIDMNQSFREWILSQLLPVFPQQGSIIVTQPGSHRAWGFPVDHTPLRTLAVSMDKGVWSAAELRTALLKIKQWWEVDWPEISRDIETVEDLKGEFANRMELIDMVLEKATSNPMFAELRADGEIRPWLDAMLADSQPYGSSFWRYRLAAALVDRNVREQWRVAQGLISELSDTNILESTKAAPHVIDLWLRMVSIDESGATQFLVCSLAALIASRRMPGLSWSLGLMIEVVLKKPQFVDDQVFSLIEIGLKHMLRELSYLARKDGSSIPDDLVPAIRLRCVQLSTAIRLQLANRPSEIVDQWVREIDTDPLPEIRHLKD